MSSVDQITTTLETPFSIEEENEAVALVNIFPPTHVQKTTLFWPTNPSIKAIYNFNNLDDLSDNSIPYGSSLICISPCEDKHPKYKNVRHICESMGLSSSKVDIKYGWDIMKSDHTASSITLNTFSMIPVFNHTSENILDAILIPPSSSVRCSITLKNPQPSNAVTSLSEIVYISRPGRNNCERRTFSNKFITSYVENSNVEHPNTIEIGFEIPHRVGYIPLISTLPMHNIRYIITDKSSVQHHPCSNFNDNSTFSKTDGQVLIIMICCSLNKC